MFEHIEETTAERIDAMCWPSHHDYMAPAIYPEGPMLMFCRLCGDVRALVLPTPPEPIIKEG